MIHVSDGLYLPPIIGWGLLARKDAVLKDAELNTLQQLLNDRGWRLRFNEELEREFQQDYARRYFATDGWEIHWTMIRALMASVADTAIVPLQDVLGLGAEARMNTPGKAEGNWQWRYKPEQLDPNLSARLKEMVVVYGRTPVK